LKCSESEKSIFCWYRLFHFLSVYYLCSTISGSRCKQKIL